jgi:hypothetical protein
VSGVENEAVPCTQEGAIGSPYPTTQFTVLPSAFLKSLVEWTDFLQ